MPATAKDRLLNVLAGVAVVGWFVFVLVWMTP